MIEKKGRVCPVCLCTNPMPVSDYVVNPEESRYLNESLIILYDQLARKGKFSGPIKPTHTPSRATQYEIITKECVDKHIRLEYLKN
ncbi:hypothetical protein EYC84_011043 [Monilinia fructicola]|uniref:Uncharacterized protein n=1 Tax=Monilinia fructicola TaxID=38448 RepID=A0A5M9JDN4_MONFR|nr:hypothetical protein EYC84_011043 [Monilinia fructicola]